MPRTGIEKERRIERAIDIIINGARCRQVLNTIQDEFGVTERTAASDYKEAHRRLAEEDKESLADKKRRAEALLWQIAVDAKARAAPGDYPAAVQALRQYCKINGLEEPTKVQLSGSVNVAPAHTLTPDERRREIEALQQKQLQSGNVIDVDPDGGEQ